MANDPATEFASPPAAQPKADKWLVLLVHGVGPTEPSQMIDQVEPALVDVLGLQVATPPQYEMVKLPDGHAPGATFPAFVRRAATLNGAYVIGEVYWADLSGIRSGTLELLAGIFRLVFSVRYVADQAAAQRTRSAKVLRWLLYLTAVIPRGPLLATYVVATLFATILLIGNGLQRVGLATNWYEGTPSILCFAIAGLIAVLAGNTTLIIRRARHFGAFRGFMTLAGVGALGFCALVHWNGSSFVVRWLLDRIHADNSGITTSRTAEFFLATTVWASECLFGAAVALLTASLIATIVACAIADRPSRPGLRIAYLTMVLQVALWSLVLTPFDFYIVDMLTHRFQDADKTVYLADLYQYFLWQLIAICIVVGSAVATWAALRLWAKLRTKSSWPDERPPRLIVGGAIQLTLLAASLDLMVFTLYLSYVSDFSWTTSNNLAMLLTWLVLILLVGTLLFFNRQSFAVLHVVMDVVNHFHRPEAKFPIRRRIAARFHRVLDYLLAVEKPTHLAIIAHSQGTIIAVQSLAKARWTERFRRSTKDCLRASLLTFGSPFTHLYQHYFPSQYRGLKSSQWSNLKTNLDRWSNVFRIDDFVGTDIDEGIDEGTGDLAAQSWPENHAADRGGHTHYWTDAIFARVADLLR